MTRLFLFRPALYTHSGSVLVATPLSHDRPAGRGEVQLLGGHSGFKTIRKVWKATEKTAL